MTSSGEGQRSVSRIVRARQGRRLGGVCSGLPSVWGLGTNGLRLAFILAALLGGIGIVVYLACWLVIPAADQDPDADPLRSIVLLAWATGGLVALVLIAAVAALATMFGLGWIVFGLGTLVGAVGFSPLRTRIPAVGVLLVLGALTLPAVAVALSPLRLTFQSGSTVVSPRRFREVGDTTYRSGFGTLLIDLRRTPVPTPGTRATLRIDAGLRRTIVALPSDACIRVRVNYDIHLFPAHLAALLTGRGETSFHDLVLFGRPFGYGARLGTSGSVTSDAGAVGPLLTIDFTSQGGSLYVRNYPRAVDPDLEPQWPGFPVTPEPRPFVNNVSLKVRRQMLREWRRRLVNERASQRQIKRDLPGPCAG